MSAKKEVSESVSVFIRIIALFALTGLIFILGDNGITGNAASGVFGGASNYISGILALVAIVAFAYLAFKKTGF